MENKNQSRNSQVNPLVPCYEEDDTFVSNNPETLNTTDEVHTTHHEDEVRGYENLMYQ